MKNHLIVILGLALMSILLACKTKPSDLENSTPPNEASYEALWKKIDSLENKGLLSSALEEVRKIKQLALHQQVSTHLIKSVLHENRYLNSLEEDAGISALSRAESDVLQYPEPAKSILHSLLAQWYEQYLNSRLWQLRNVSAYTGPAGPDMRTWGIQHFTEKIRNHYAASLVWPGLTAAPVKDYELLLTEGKETDNLRPTLYDILAHRAIDHYAGGMQYLTDPIEAFVLNQPEAMGDARSFVQIVFPTTDSLNPVWLALQLHQQLLRFRLGEPSQTDALLDADLKRLHFVHDHGILEQKDSLYESALQRLQSAHQSSPEVTMVYADLAELYVEQAQKWNPEDDTYKDHYQKAHAICTEAIRKFPESYGAQKCQQWMTTIETKYVTASVESILLPEESVLMKIEYRNVPEIHFRLFRLPQSPGEWPGHDWNSDTWLQKVLALEQLNGWKQTLKGTEDYHQHSTEVPVAPFEPGHYAIVYSHDNAFSKDSSTTGVMTFTVTNLAYWYISEQNRNDGIVVVHRKSGVPLQGVKAEYYSRDYQPSNRRHEDVKIGEGISDAKGWIKFDMKQDRNLRVRLTQGKDELFPEQNYYRHYYQPDPKSTQSTVFFSDRSIYRPGQKIYFKGYAVRFDEKRIPSIVPNESVQVTLYDANQKEVSKLSVTSNAYGTFAGHFDIPRSGLTGTMSLRSGFGGNSYSFQVEEYKRPKFEVVFDTLRQTPRLNDEVNVKAIAKDYAGSLVGGAQVFYQVKRVAFRPWWFSYWRQWPSDDESQLLASGKAITEEDGSVDISFVAGSKPGSDKDLHYRFEIMVRVTDITGETHDATKTLVLNQQGINVNIQLPTDASIDQLTAISAIATNADDHVIPVKANIVVTELIGPEVNKRERLWASPDILTITPELYRQSFSPYFIPGKEDRSTWDKMRETGKATVNIDGTTPVDLSRIIAKPGYYQISWNIENQGGQEMKIDQYILVYSPSEKLPGHEVMRVHTLDSLYQPGHSAEASLLTGLTGSAMILKIGSEDRQNAGFPWLTANPVVKSQDDVKEADRGGMYFHYLAVYNNRFYQHMHHVQVPWSNKELDVTLTTWRDKVEPGADEAWMITTKGEKGEALAAEMLLSMYDASLDAFIPHQWSMQLYPAKSNRWTIYGTSPQEDQTWTLTNHWNQYYSDAPYRQYRDLNSFGYYLEGAYYMPRGGRMRSGAAPQAMEGVMLQAAPAADMDDEAGNKAKVTGDETEESVLTTSSANAEKPALRTALEETVFFYPQLTTNAQGQLQFTFKMKDGLTRWKFQALAHTTALAYGFETKEIVSQKDLMVFPNPPRFLRTGDTIDFQIKVSNLTDKEMTLTSSLHLVDAFTGEDVSHHFGLNGIHLNGKVTAKGSSPFHWTLHIPVDWTRPVLYRVSATNGQHTDGEEALVPVVTNRILLTESLPLPLKAKETRTFVFSAMSVYASGSAAPHLYTVEMTSSPAWYAVQALPYLMEYPYECAEQVFGRLYANSLAAHIVKKQPAIERIYKVWRETGDPALQSPLEKNQELKSIMLEETPWVRDAMGETQQRKDIALLFESNRIALETNQAIVKLAQMQLSNGGFPWFPGGRDNWYITQYIAEGIGHLRKLGVTLPQREIQDLIGKAIPYLDGRMMEWYNELKRLEKEGKLKMSDKQIGAMQIHYLYMRSFYPEVQHVAALDEIRQYLKTQVEQYWLSEGLYAQGLAALASHRTWPNAEIAKTILNSLQERTIYHEELGRYWKMQPGFSWSESQIETQSLMIELFQEMNVPQREVDELRVWLLKQKQTTRWKTTKSTATAVYALLIHPDSWLESTQIAEVMIGSDRVISQGDQTQAGTGYIKKSWSGDQIKNDWSQITVSNPNAHIAWGGVYYQYWEDLDKVKPAVEHNPLKVTRTLLKLTEGTRGEQSVPVTGRLNIGDRILIRLTVETDRIMEFVHLKDVRAAGVEPVDVISGYRWKGSVGYYQNTRDLATHFFIDYLPRGKHVIEYAVTVAQAGQYSDGLAQLQSMYAPEFTTHSQSGRIEAVR